MWSLFLTESRLHYVVSLRLLEYGLEKGSAVDAGVMGQGYKNNLQRRAELLSDEVMYLWGEKKAQKSLKLQTKLGKTVLNSISVQLIVQ